MFLKKNKEFFEILFFLIVAGILVYLVPASLNRLIFLIVLPLAWITKRDYIWLAFFFIVTDYPGGFFSGGLVDDPYRLPIYSIMPGVSFTIRELYLLLLLAKVLFKPECKRKQQRNYFTKELSLLGLYLIFLLFISVFLGMTFDNFVHFYKVCLNLTMFISVPVILGDRKTFERFFRILFPFAIIALFFQSYSLILGEQPVTFFKPDARVQGVWSLNENATGWLRPIEMPYILLLCFTGSLFFLKNKYFKTEYLIMINLISFLSIFLAATRSWFIALLVIYVYYFFSNINYISRKFVNYIIIAFIILVGVSFVPVIKNQIYDASDRLSTLEKVAEGDITAGGTVNRFNVRGPNVMKGFKSSTIIAGAGFSNLYYQYQDGHVGYQNMLLNTGIVGMFLFLLLFVKALFLPFNLSKSKFLSFFAKYELRTSILLLIALLVINTGTQMLGYTPDGNNRFFLMILALTFINQAINFTTESFFMSKKIIIT